jgi:hypothetical protein
MYVNYLSSNVIFFAKENFHDQSFPVEFKILGFMAGFWLLPHE